VQQAYDSVIVGAVKGGAIGLTFGLGAAAALQYGIKAKIFQNLTVAGKFFIISSAAVAGFWIGAEKSLINYVKNPYGDRWGNASSKSPIELAQNHQSQIVQETDGKNQVAQITTSKPSTFLGMDQKTLLKYRYHIVGGVWVASVAGSLAWTFQQKHLRFSQKLIQARVFAQGMTIAGLLGTALLTQIPVSDRTEEEEDEPWMKKKY